jgi:O-antigen ligase
VIRRTLHLVLLVLAFCCAMRHWQYYVGVRVVVADALLAGFAALYLLRTVARGGVPRVASAFWLLIGGLWVLFAAQLLTGFALDPALQPFAQTQFLKGLANNLLYTVGFSSVLFFLGEESPEWAQRTLRVYILGAVASALFSFVELFAALRGIDLPKLVFASISTYGPDYDPKAAFIFEWDNFYRTGGFTGVNAQATYTASVIPLLLVAAPFRRRWVNLICGLVCFVGMMLTLSRNGLATLIIATCALAALQPARTLKLAGKLALFSIPLVALFAVFRGEAARLVATRTYSSIEHFASGRKEIYRAVWPTISAHPLGHGLNQFSVHMLHSDDIFMGEITAMYPTKDETWARNAYANVHNNWLNWLFEGGWVLFGLWIVYFGVLLWICVRRHTSLGHASFATLFALLISGYFNMTLDTFSVQVLFAILPATVVLTGPAGCRRTPSSDSSAPHLLQPC